MGSRVCYSVAAALIVSAGLLTGGCAKHQPKPTITAVGLSPGNRCEPPGIPYYLPKPLLVIAKNVRHIDESKVGLTAPATIPNGFDNQASYADVKANVTVPRVGGGVTGVSANKVAAAPLSRTASGSAGSQAHVPAAMLPGDSSDGLQPDSFYTYQIVFVPDLSQKYGLQITGGAGEFRAALNMVNGWMYTGMGPFYLKDSSSAQNAMATGVGAMFAGRGASDVIDSVGGLTETIGDISNNESALQDLQTQQDLQRAIAAIEAASRSAPRVQQQILNYAEIYIYEPHLLPDQSTEWQLVAEHHFDRDYLETVDTPAAATERMKVLQQLILPRAGKPAQTAADPKPATSTTRRSSSRANNAATNQSTNQSTNDSSEKTDGEGRAESAEQAYDDGTGDSMEQGEGNAPDDIDVPGGIDETNAPPDFLRNGPLGPESLPQPRSENQHNDSSGLAPTTDPPPLVRQDGQLQVQPPVNGRSGRDALPRVSQRPLLGKFHPVIEERRPVQATLRGPSQRAVGDIVP